MVTTLGEDRLGVDLEHPLLELKVSERAEHIKAVFDLGSSVIPIFTDIITRQSTPPRFETDEIDTCLGGEMLAGVGHASIKFGDKPVFNVGLTFTQRARGQELHGIKCPKSVVDPVGESVFDHQLRTPVERCERSSSLNIHTIRQVLRHRMPALADLERELVLHVAELVEIDVDISVAKPQRGGIPVHKVEIRLNLTVNLHGTITVPGNIHSQPSGDRIALKGHAVINVLTFKIESMVKRTKIKHVFGSGLGITSIENRRCTEETVRSKLTIFFHLTPLGHRVGGPESG